MHVHYKDHENRESMKLEKCKYHACTLRMYHNFGTYILSVSTQAMSSNLNSKRRKCAAGKH